MKDSQDAKYIGYCVACGGEIYNDYLDVTDFLPEQSENSYIHNDEDCKRELFRKYKFDLSQIFDGDIENLVSELISENCEVISHEN